MPTGTFDISTLLAARFQSVAAFGMETVQQILAADVAAHNALIQQAVAEICDVTTDRQRLSGSSTSTDMTEVDEYGRAPTERDVVGSTVAFPLRKFQHNLGWTSEFFKTKTPADMAIMTQAAEKAHKRQVMRQIQRAIFGATNYTFIDHLVDNVSLAVRRFVNADGLPIPDGPNGETFSGAVHTHFTAAAALAVANITALINSVVEHGHGGQVKLAINVANETAVRALVGFTAYPDPRLVLRVTDTPERTVNITQLNNRAIGILGAAEVWVKPWAIANYVFAWDSSEPGKPLAFRQRDAAELQGLRIAAALDTHPLYAQYMEAEFGVGVWTRTNGACHYFAGAVWADPVI